MRKVLVWVAVILAGRAAPLVSQQPIGPMVDSIARQVLEATGVPSASVAVVQDGKLVYTQAYGSAQVEPAVPARVDMRYSIGSISKQFAAAAILLLQQDGKLSLDDPVAALWRLGHADTTGARAIRRWLEADVDRASRFAGWARLIDVLVTEREGGDVRAALLRMDSVVRELPLPAGFLRWDPVPAEVQNLILARMLGRYGEPRLALAAARRRIYRAVANYPDALPEYLREEGRLAALTGDTAGAIRAYRHYLALRESPDPLWRAPWDSVRAELGALMAR